MEEPKIIAEIRIHDEAPVSHQEQFLDEYNNCPLCGTTLEFAHVTDFAYGLVEEEAHCGPCKIRTKKDTHCLQ